MSANKKDKRISFSKILGKRKGKDTSSKSEENNNSHDNPKPRSTTIKKSRSRPRPNPRQNQQPNFIYDNGIATNTNINGNNIKKNIESGNGSDEIGSGIALQEYLNVLFHYKWMILTIFITVLLAVVALSYLQEPVYKARTKIFIQEDVMELQVINEKPYFKKGYDLQTWIQIMESTEITQRASDTISNRASSSEISRMIDYTTERDDEHIITATATSNDPQLAADVANAVFYAISQYDTEQRLRGYTYSTGYLDQLIHEKRKELNETTNFIEKFMNKKGIDANTVNLENNVTRVNELQKQIDDSRVELAAVTASVKKINHDLKREEHSIVNQTTYSEPYKIRLMNLEADKARALTNYTAQHPRVRAIEANINNVKKLIKEGINETIQLKNVEENPIKRRLVNDLLEKETEKVALVQKIQALKKLLSEIKISPDAKEILQDKFNSKKDLIIQISNLQAQYSKAKLNTNISSSRLFQLQVAEVPTKSSSDNLKRDIMIGIVLGLGLGIGIALLLNFFNDTIRSVSEYEEKYTIPVIGNIPKTDTNVFEQLVNYWDQEGEAKEDKKTNKTDGKSDEVEKKNDDTAKINPKFVDEFLKIESIFEPIIINFKYLILSKDQKVFAIQSSLTGEGKTFISYFLANNLAKENLDVLLIDADFFKQTLSKKLGFRNKGGLSEVLSEQVELNDAIVHNKDSKFLFLPAGQKPPNILEMYRSSNFQYILDELREMYDIVIIDTPAFLQVPSIAYFLSEVDGTILPVKINSTTFSSLNKEIAKSEIYNVNILGAIMNFTQFIDNKYDYGYGYGYGEEEDLDKKGKKDKKKIKNIKKDVSKTQKPKLNMFQRIYSSAKDFLFFEEEE